MNYLEPKGRYKNLISELQKTKDYLELSEKAFQDLTGHSMPDTNKTIKKICEENGFNFSETEKEIREITKVYIMQRK